MSNRIQNDKYYTPIKVAEQCIDEAYKTIGKENVNRIIEPSAGNGSFSSQIDKCIAFDIEPEAEGIIKGDYLKAEIEYMPGTLVIGNPPFGRCMEMAKRFFKKSTEVADYIAFILPISQYRNSKSMYQFDLIKSIDLGVHKYTDRRLHCCFNIYERPKGGIRKKQNTKLNDITIIRDDQKGFENAEYDLRMCYWGNGSAGKILSQGEKYAAEYKIIINNKALEQRVKEVLTQVDWKKRLNCIAALKIQKFHIAELLKEKIPEIE